MWPLRISGVQANFPKTCVFWVAAAVTSSVVLLDVTPAHSSTPFIYIHPGTVISWKIDCSLSSPGQLQGQDDIATHFYPSRRHAYFTGCQVCSLGDSLAGVQGRYHEEQNSEPVLRMERLVANGVVNLISLQVKFFRETVFFYEKVTGVKKT